MSSGLWYFGLLDNGCLAVAMAAGYSLERVWVPKRWRSPAATMAAAALVGNTVSDGLAAVPMGWRAVAAVMAGCIVGPFLAMVPVGAWRWVSNGLVGERRRRVATARDASEG